MISTKRIIQLGMVADSCASNARVLHRCANKALAMNRMKQWEYFFKQACRNERIVARCFSRGVIL